MASSFMQRSSAAPIRPRRRRAGGVRSSASHRRRLRSQRHVRQTPRAYAGVGRLRYGLNTLTVPRPRRPRPRSASRTTHNDCAREEFVSIDVQRRWGDTVMDGQQHAPEAGAVNEVPVKPSHCILPFWTPHPHHWHRILPATDPRQCSQGTHEGVG